MPGWSARRAATGRAWVTTVSEASSGMAAASRATVVPASRITLPSVGSSARAACAMRSFSSAAVRLALGEVGLEVEPPGRDGAAVHPADEAGPVEGLQIAPDGLGGDLELLGEGQHVHPAAVTGEPEDLLLPLRCVHVGLRPFHARTCGFARQATPGFPESKQIRACTRARTDCGQCAERGPAPGDRPVRRASAENLCGSAAARPALRSSPLSASAPAPAAPYPRRHPPRPRPPPPVLLRPRRQGEHHRKITASTAATHHSACWKASAKAGPTRRQRSARRSTPKKTTETRPRPSALPIWLVGVDQPGRRTGVLARHLGEHRVRQRRDDQPHPDAHDDQRQRPSARSGCPVP